MNMLHSMANDYLIKRFIYSYLRIKGDNHNGTRFEGD